MAIFTSGAALRLGQVVPIAERISAYCVGSATTDLARSFGFSSQQAGETVQQLRQSLIDAPPRAPLMHFRGRHSTGDLAKELQLAGLQCQERIVYDQTSQNLSDAAKKLLESGRDVIAPVFSSRSAAILSGQLEICSGRLFLVAISQKVADQWAGAQPHRIICALTPDQNAMQIAVKETYAALQ